MIARITSLAAGAVTAAALSQFPEYSQQYTQRLGGAVDELSRQIDRLEAQAAAEGVTPAVWLAALAEEGPRARTQAEAMAEDIARHAALSADLAALRGAGPFSRTRLAGHMGDPQIMRQTWADYRPALPMTFEGGVFAATGFALGWGALAAVLAMLRGAAGMVRPRRRRRDA